MRSALCATSTLLRPRAGDGRDIVAADKRYSGMTKFIAVLEPS